MHYSYIVRVYRHKKNSSGMIVGTVEKIDEKRKAAFTTVDELWEILNGGAGNGLNKDFAGEAVEHEGLK